MQQMLFFFIIVVRILYYELLFSDANTLTMSIKQNYYKISFKTLGDERGNLIALENNTNLPFEIKRVYYIFNTKENVRRGFHAHKKLKQVLVNVKGSCSVLLDNGKYKESVNLSKPNQGLYIEGAIWHEMYDFSDDCVLLVVADELYDEKDYIRNYEDFLEYVKKTSSAS